MNSKLEYIKENLGIINEMIENKRPKFEIARVLNVKYETLNKHLKAVGIQYEGNPNRKGIPHLEGRVLLDEYLNGNRNVTASKLRNKLIEEGLKEYRCEKCGRTEWEGRPIPLELHHKNMNHNDNRLENLQILCSNCHSLAHDYCNTKSIKNSEVNFELFNRCLSEKLKTNDEISKKIKKTKEKRFCETCGKELVGQQKKYCSQKCSHKSQTQRPLCEVLIKKIKECHNNISAVGRLYNVSEATIRNWKKYYGI